MARKHFLTQKELQMIMDAPSDDECGSNEIVLNENTEVIYIPPAKVDCISDEECIDDEDLTTDNAPNMEIAGEVEVRFDSTDQDFAAPQDCAMQTDSPQENEYPTLESFGEPKWKKTKRAYFKFGDPNEDGVIPIRNRILIEMGGYYLFIIKFFVLVTIYITCRWKITIGTIFPIF